MKHMSQKRVANENEARRWRTLYKLLFPLCQFPGCIRQGEDLHEISRGTGRQDSLAVFSAMLHLCREHHDWLHRYGIRYGLAVKKLANDGLFHIGIVCELYGWMPTAIDEEELDSYVAEIKSCLI